MLLGNLLDALPWKNLELVILVNTRMYGTSRQESYERELHASWSFEKGAKRAVTSTQKRSKRLTLRSVGELLPQGGRLNFVCHHVHEQADNRTRLAPLLPYGLLT